LLPLLPLLQICCVDDRHQPTGGWLRCVLLVCTVSIPCNCVVSLRSLSAAAAAAVAVALLRSLGENPSLKTYLDSGWEASWELCIGAPSAETFWTGIACLDPFDRPGVVEKM
jgi:hypothetical protein